ncbi:hypothetical protein BJ742DRAFT_810513 [Cladochytrium replicatum]|nr:hypothetical protein BJ742DRAFT_810513 [Cladochytrium replicatum]
MLAGASSVVQADSNNQEITAVAFSSSAEGQDKDRTFEVRSGEVVWGHFQCVLKGAGLLGDEDGEDGDDEYVDKDVTGLPGDVGSEDGDDGEDGEDDEKETVPGFHDNNTEQRESLLCGGTILRWELKFRCAARKGSWKVRRVYMLDEPDSTRERLVGWVMCHEDFDPLDVVKRVALVGKSLGNGHDDRNVKYINRYDWGDFAPISQEHVAAYLREKLKKDTDDRDTDNWSGYMLALDAAAADAKFMHRFFDRSCPRRSVWAETFFKKGDKKFGTCVEDFGSEYELGWLTFSGQKHAQFPESDELIGLVYDSAYSGFYGHHFRVE